MAQGTTVGTAPDGAGSERAPTICAPRDGALRRRRPRGVRAGRWLGPSGSFRGLGSAEYHPTTGRLPSRSHTTVGNAANPARGRRNRRRLREGGAGVAGGRRLPPIVTRRRGWRRVVMDHLIPFCNRGGVPDVYLWPQPVAETTFAVATTQSTLQGAAQLLGRG